MSTTLIRALLAEYAAARGRLESGEGDLRRIRREESSAQSARDEAAKEVKVLEAAYKELTNYAGAISSMRDEMEKAIGKPERVPTDG